MLNAGLYQRYLRIQSPAAPLPLRFAAQRRKPSKDNQMGCIEPSLGIGMVVALPFCVRQARACDSKAHSLDSPDSRSIITDTDSQSERRYDLTFNILSTVNQNRKSGMSGFQAIFQSSTVFVSDEKEMPIFTTRLPSAW